MSPEPKKIKQAVFAWSEYVTGPGYSSTQQSMLGKLGRFYKYEIITEDLLRLAM